MTRAVFFDVDFTLIYPGPTFQGAGYRDFCSRYGVAVDPSAFEQAVASASTLLDSEGGIYDPEVFALSSFEHGYMKPHRSIFEAALRATGARPQEAVMVGDSYPHDIEGALRTGMRAVLVCRSGAIERAAAGVPVIASLRELPSLL